MFSLVKEFLFVVICLTLGFTFANIIVNLID
jgi:hypothetical protein